MEWGWRIKEFPTAFTELRQILTFCHICFIIVFFFSLYTCIISFLEEFENKFQNNFSLSLNTLMRVPDILCCIKKKKSQNLIVWTRGQETTTHGAKSNLLPVLNSLWTKNGLYVFRCLEKLKWKNISWHMKIIWNSDFLVHK